MQSISMRRLCFIDLSYFKTAACLLEMDSIDYYPLLRVAFSN